MKRREFIGNILKASPWLLASNSFANIDMLIKQPNFLVDFLNNPPNIDGIVLIKNDIKDDIFLSDEYKILLKSVEKKLNFIQSYVGHGNFNIISFDDSSNILKRSSTQKRFTKEELAFIEYIFYYKPNVHGFYGERTSSSLTSKINKKDVKKIPYTGHFLFKGDPISTYNSMKKDVGDTLVLTSGVRSVVKQLKLFLNKLKNEDFNISKASHTIAPPAFSYHSVGDFDVGKKGFGASNFTEKFETTTEFKEIKKLKYIDIRYTLDNKDGVRYEPWHIKVI